MMDDAGLSQAIIQFRAARTSWERKRQRRYRDAVFMSMEVNSDLELLHTDMRRMAQTLGTLQQQLNTLIEVQAAPPGRASEAGHAVRRRGRDATDLSESCSVLSSGQF